MKTLIITAFAQDYYRYLSDVLKVHPVHNKEYKLCLTPESMRGIIPSDVKECLYLRGRTVTDARDYSRLHILLEYARVRGFNIKEVDY